MHSIQARVAFVVKAALALRRETLEASPEWDAKKTAEQALWDACDALTALAIDRALVDAIAVTLEDVDAALLPTEPVAPPPEQAF